MNDFGDADVSDSKIERSLAASIARHEAAVKSLKWHLEMDSRSGCEDYTRSPSSTWYNGRTADYSSFGDSSLGLKQQSEFKSLPPLSKFDEDQSAGARVFLERKLRRIDETKLSQWKLPPRQVQLPSPPPTPPLMTGFDGEVDNGACGSAKCCWEENCWRTARVYEPNEYPWADRGTLLDDVRTDRGNDLEELVAARYQYGRWDARPAGAETSLDGPADWPYACRPFFFRRADTPSARYY